MAKNVIYAPRFFPCSPSLFQFLLSGFPHSFPPVFLSLYRISFFCVALRCSLRLHLIEPLINVVKFNSSKWNVIWSFLLLQWLGILLPFPVSNAYFTALHFNSIRTVYNVHVTSSTLWTWLVWQTYQATKIKKHPKQHEFILSAQFSSVFVAGL